MRDGLVLVVDDHPQFRRLARRILEAAGFSVAEAGNGAEAIAAARDLGPRAVLLDIQLPDCDGFHVARVLAGSDNPPAVVLTSTREASDYGVRLTSSSAIAFLPKTDLSSAALRELLVDV